jgi:Skp family chaperone for outer membrane proteins
MTDLAAKLRGIADKAKKDAAKEAEKAYKAAEIVRKKAEEEFQQRRVTWFEKTYPDIIQAMVEVASKGKYELDVEPSGYPVHQNV